MTTVCPLCLLNILPGNTFISWPGTNIVSSTSNTNEPDIAKLSIAILAWPFIICWLSSIFSAIPIPKKLYGFLSYGKAWYGILYGVNGLITALSNLSPHIHAFICTSSKSSILSDNSIPTSLAYSASIIPQYSRTSKLVW